MVVIVDFSVPAEQFALGRLFEVFPDIQIELERVIPVESGVIPLLWISEAEPGKVTEEIRGDPIVDDVKVLTRADERSLLQIDWDPNVNSLIGPLIRNEADLLRGEGDPDTWTFRAQFRDRDHLVTFRDACLENDVRLDVNRLYNPRMPTETDMLSEAQTDALLMSYERGYWDIPRGTGLRTLGESLGVSDTAVSQRLRRGVKTLIEMHVLPEEDG
ncbi:MAG: helix-turn-helix domain-containing protein [Halobacteriales archaeon]|nr:helix-turn-helix domain-containing protein [Halobacteriales archaeon]